MKNIWEKLFVGIGDRHEIRFFRKSVFMIVLFLIFFAASFYLMIVSLTD